MRLPCAAILLAVALIALGVAPAPRASAAVASPSLQVATVLSGLDHAWDVGIASDSTMFVTERPGRLWMRSPGGTFHQLSVDMSDLWVAVETGLMSVEPDPGYLTNHRIYTCQGTTDMDFSVQVVAWQVNPAGTAATRVNDPLVGGIDGEAGRHGGCQLRVDPSGALIVGTGDAALGTNPQDTHSLAGKTLRVDRFTGDGLAGNPFFGNPAAGDPRIQTLGHRNVQGLALQPATNIMWSVEHGPDRDDEINQLINGKNYGWNPVSAAPGGYNESVPMTDHSIPNVQDAAWSSGIPTLATSGATFLRGTNWGPWQGALAVSTLKGSALQIFSVDAATNTAKIIATPPELNGTFGRLRGAELDPNGILYVTTDNGNGTDRVLAVSARGPGSPSPFGSLDVAQGGPGSVRVAGWAIDPDSASSIAVHVYVDGQGFVLGTASLSRPDVGAMFPGYGSSHGFDAQVSGIPPGTHTVCAYGINVGPGQNNAVGCRSVVVPSGSPFGSLDVAQVGPGSVTVAGWAIDPDTASPIALHLYVDAQGIQLGTASLSRPDVGAMFPGYGSNHGFSALAGVTPGAHTVCVYGINVGPGQNNAVGCRSVVVPSGSPFGSLDLAQGGHGSVRVAGWAIDPDTASSIAVHVYVDGQGFVLGTASFSRPDVGAMFPGYGSSHGFDAPVFGVAPGMHTVCAYGINVGPGQNNAVGCKSATVT